WSQAWTSGPRSTGRSTECVALRVWVTAVCFSLLVLQDTCRILSGVVFVAVLAQVGDGGSWLRGAPMPPERGEVGAAAGDRKVYVVGAYSGATNSNDAYDPVTDSWQTLAPLPRGLNHVCAAGSGTTLYV